MKDSQALLIVVIVLAAIFSGGYFVYSKMQGVADTAKLISDSVIQQYVELLRDSQYQEAWETCLSDQAKKDIPVNEFITAKTAHRKEFGPIIGFRNTRVTDENDISSSPSFMGIIGVLEYENRDLFVKFLVSPDIEPYKIQRIFGSSHRSTSLSEGVW